MSITPLLAQGEIREIAAGTILIEAGKTVEHLYLILQGMLTAGVRGPDGELQEVYRLGSGEVAGILAFLDGRPCPTLIQVVAPTQVLVLSCADLSAQLQQDQPYAAQFYQAIVRILSQRLRAISTLLVRSKATPPPPLRKILFLFSELIDSEISWLMTAGEQRQIAPGTTLIQEGQPADALYILLQGTLAVTVTVLVGGTWVSKEIACLGKGEIVGEMSFLDTHPPSATVTTVEECQVLVIPRSQLATQLEQDHQFAVRFSRAMAMVIVDRLRDRLFYHGYSQSTYSPQTCDAPGNGHSAGMALASERFDRFMQHLLPQLS